MSKRIFDLAIAGAGLIVLALPMLVVALWIRLDSPGPALYRQARVGRNGRLFQILKFRTMAARPDEPSSLLTVGDDPRITRAGRWLRRFKLDELPQLLNVVRGDMSLVGPRPEVPAYVALYPEDARKRILSVRPGITDLASIEFRDESTLLGNAADPHGYYVQNIMPKKIERYLRYVEEQSMSLDVKIIARTIKAVWS